MKKFIFSLSIILGLGMMANNAMAQSFGIHAGLNLAEFQHEKINYDSKPGFFIAGTYELPLTASLPLYVESGLMLSQKGALVKGGGEEVTSNIFYLEVPAMLRYKFALASDLAIVPAAGLYLGYGISGKTKWRDHDADLFGDNGFKRTDLGVRLGINMEYSCFAVGAGYEIGLLEIADKLTTRNLYISFGYKF